MKSDSIFWGVLFAMLVFNWAHPINGTDTLRAYTISTDRTNFARCNYNALAAQNVVHATCDLYSPDGREQHIALADMTDCSVISMREFVCPEGPSGGISARDGKIDMDMKIQTNYLSWLFSYYSARSLAGLHGGR